jgi:hypothetical protein
MRVGSPARPCGSPARRWTWICSARRYGHSVGRLSKIRRYAQTRVAQFISRRHRRSRAFGWWVPRAADPPDFGLISLYGIVAQPGAGKPWRDSRMPAMNDVASRVRQSRMHRLTGGRWKRTPRKQRSRQWDTLTEPQELQRCRTYRQPVAAPALDPQPMITGSDDRPYRTGFLVEAQIDQDQASPRSSVGHVCRCPRGWTATMTGRRLRPVIVRPYS